MLMLAMAVSLCGAFAGTSEAKTSLPAVEVIKTAATEADPFTILEIVPEADQGSIGYYIDGEEPWVILAGEKTSPSLRTSYVNSTLRGQLNRSESSSSVGESYSIALCDPPTLPTDAAKSDYPLNYIGNYSESYPWALSQAEIEAHREMHLATPETQTITGKMEDTAPNEGAYVLGTDGVFYPMGDGDSVQRIDRFYNEAQTGTGYWYDVGFSELSYQELVKEGEADPNAVSDYTLVLRAADSEDNAGDIIDVSVDGVSMQLVAVGVVGDPNFPGLEIGETYYKATWDKPHTDNSFDATNNKLWASTEAGFRDVVEGEIGYFRMTNYMYVGAGNGDYNLINGTKDYNTTTSVVYYTGGFTNNNWFAKYVMDWDDTEPLPEIEVKTVAARDLTETQVKSADMIILNYGFNIAGTTYQTVYCNDFGIDFTKTAELGLVQTYATTGVTNALTNETLKVPVVVDHSLAYGSSSAGLDSSDNTVIKDTVKAIVDNAAEVRGYADVSAHRTFAAENTYVLDAFGVFDTETEDGETATVHVQGMPLVSTSVTYIYNAEINAGALEKYNFGDTYVGTAELETDPFYPVAEGIVYDNFLRQVRYGKDTAMLANDITEASTVRYIINFANSRQIKNKTTVNVLDIEPRTSITENGLGPDKKAQIAEWLGIDESNLKVTTMSTSEFNGIQTNICEQFDLIYIGDSTDGFNTGEASINVADDFLSAFLGKNSYDFDYIKYNDTSMTYEESGPGPINETSVESYLTKRAAAGWFFNATDSQTTFGMRYTAIGDKVTSGSDYKLSGLLDRDYTENYNVSKWDLLLGTCKYYYGTVINATGNTNTFRYSGNDLTATAADEIEKFADLGYPVIFADTLLKPPEFNDANKKIARVWLEGSVTGIDNANVAGAEPTMYSEGDVLKISIDTIYAIDLLRWRINSARLTLYKQTGSSPNPSTDQKLDSVQLGRREYNYSFNLSDYELKEISLIQPWDTFYCTYEIISYNNLLADWLDNLWFIGNLFNIKRQIGYTESVTMRGDAEEMFVDNSSEMFAMINNMVGSFNVMSFAALDSSVVNYRRTLLPKLVNLSKPTIEFLGEGEGQPLAQDVYPTVYSNNNGSMTSMTAKDGIYTLEFKFKIQNDADPYPDTTRYKMELYLDNNGNGKFETDEMITDLSARDLTVYSDEIYSVGDRVENGDLLGSYGTGTYSSASQHYYYVYYQLPASVQGLIPWKLKVVETYTDDGGQTKTGGHDSVIDYTRIEREDTQTIDILQINSVGTNSLNLQRNIAGNKIYGELLGAVESDFKVSMTTIPANFDSSLWTTTATPYGTSTTGSTGSTTVNTLFTKDGAAYTRKTDTGEQEAFASLTDLFKSYDMLIIGFGDAYKDLDLDVTEALANYIKAGKPVLMTHDTLSYYSLADGAFVTSNSDASLSATNIGSFWHPNYVASWSTNPSYVYGSATTSYGYYSNMLIRDLIGVDRYGVTSLKTLISGQSIGVNKYAGIGRTTDITSTASATQLAESSLRTYIKSLDGFSSWNGGYVPSTVYYSDAADINTTRRRILDEIEADGYSIAWKAGTGRNKTVSETQGLTTGVLFRFINGSNSYSYNIAYSSSDGSHIGLTNAVTQVNRGQITTYPYNINTAAFGTGGNGTSGTGELTNNQSVTSTHAQNYQLNLNYSADGSTSDMIVWYCLADSNGSSIYQENDVTNNYYVYTVGNVTYTGSGHTTDAFDTTVAAATDDVKFEAKLFVNTMVAAYRANFKNTGVSFTNKTGTETNISDFFVVTDGDTILKTDSAKYSKDETRNIYFTASDSNMPDGAVSMYFSAEFKYNGSNQSVNIYEADTGKRVENGQLKNTYTYYIKLDELLATIGTSDINVIKTNGLTLTVTPVYVFSDNSTSLGTAKSADLNLRQYRLFDLS